LTDSVQPKLDMQVQKVNLLPRLKKNQSLFPFVRLSEKGMDIIKTLRLELDMDNGLRKESPALVRTSTWSKVALSIWTI
jgi:hypothetical protein